MTEGTRISADDTIALLEETLEATHDGLLVLDLDRRIVRYNKQFVRLFGLTAEEIDRGGMDAVVAALSSQVEDAGRLLSHAADPWLESSVELLDTLRFKDGRVYERFIAPHRVRDRVVGRVVSYRDVTQTVRAEEALERHRAFLEKAQEVAHVGSWVADLGSHRLEWSTETFRIFGVDRASFEGTGEAFLPFVYPADLDEFRRALRSALDDDVAFDIEHRIVRADGTIRWVHERADVMRDGTGAPIRMIGTVQDITERRHLEEQLRQSQKLEAIGRLAGGVANDLNTALTAIIGFTELALGALASEHPARVDVQEIRRAAGRAEAVTRQLLAFSRKQMLDPREFSLCDSVNGIRHVIESTLGPSITLSFDAAPVPPVYADPGQIEQAILNIIVNARDAMPEGGTVTLNVLETIVDEAFAESHRPMPPGRYVQVRIADTGHGMDPATQAHIFEPFFTTKDVGKGTGLGLAMVYGTVRQTGGYVYVGSEPGRGAAFSLFFPVHERKRPQSPARAARQEKAAATILVVEDEPAIRRIAATALERAGHRVLQAASAEDALRIFDGPTAIDLLLTDASMPGMSGVELVQTLAARYPTLPMVIMSGFTEEALNMGENGLPAALIPKPFAPAELQRRIGEILEGRQPDRP